ncbi:unnamed protein product [Spodoptera littoralis]|uniref:Carboxylesterase type B domain-containing protein n=1 Tax=Spodoptera littoralis TaxID=7109 RepID=A0A9P0N1B9_SPOLI|nr:unnamed protein product [Spodoptera littoralis]CAH1637984.1 unnamed protein product [Spodoptera littoralis]
MRLGAVGVVLTVSTVTYVAVARPTPVPRVHRDVVTLQGTVRGYLASNPPHFAYYGIPYAGSLTQGDRFKDPQPPPKWGGIFEALHKIKCPQVKAAGDENCLVVNIFTPQKQDATLLPVVVFVHGGDLQSGWGAHRPPALFLEEGNNVIVTFNYRLGSLGFLCLRTPDVPGNAGLKDQIAALYWVHRNIHQFGGNPQDVTVYATEAAAITVQLILLSELVEGFLHKVILEQGSDDPDELYQFYLKASDEELVTIPEIFCPCVDNTTDNVHNLIDVDPMRKLEDGLFTNVPMILTFTPRDTASILGTDLKKFEKPPDHFEYLLPHNLEFKNEKVKSEVAKIVKKFYFPDDFTRNSMVHNYAYYAQDILVEYPIIKVAMMFAAKSAYPVYVMKFTLPKVNEDSDKPESTNLDTILDYLHKDKAQINLFGELVTMLLRNFKTLGDPTPLTTAFIPLIWQSVHTEGDSQIHISDVQVLHLGPTRLTVSPHHNPRLKFWDKVYTKFHRAHKVSDEETEDMLNSKEEEEDHDDNDLYKLVFSEEK